MGSDWAEAPVESATTGSSGSPQARQKFAEDGLECPLGHDRSEVMVPLGNIAAILNIRTRSRVAPPFRARALRVAKCRSFAWSWVVARDFSVIWLVLFGN